MEFENTVYYFIHIRKNKPKKNDFDKNDNRLHKCFNLGSRKGIIAIRGKN